MMGCETDQDAAIAAATVVDEARSAVLADLLGRVAGCFPRRETRQSCGQMMGGLLMELEDHNCWTIAETAGHRGPQRLQHVPSRAVWDDQQVLDIAAGWAVGHYGCLAPVVPARRFVTQVEDFWHSLTIVLR